MTSIGHQTGLFDTMAGLPPATSERIAKAAGLQERYVREWLGAMVAGRIVEYDTAEKTYVLPPEHAAFLTRAASPNNLAVTMQFIPLLGAVEEQIIEAFINGGGVPYSSYPTFHRVMAEESNQTVVAGLLNAILPLMGFRVPAGKFQRPFAGNLALGGQTRGFGFRDEGFEASPQIVRHYPPVEE